MDAELESRLRTMLDKQEISEVIMRYCRGVDRGDPSLIAAAYHPDAVDDHGNIQLAGHDCAKSFARKNGPSSFTGQMSQHFMGQQLIEVEGDIAFAETYFVSAGTTEAEGKEVTRLRAARYVDRFERRDGEWRIAYRVVVDDWNRFDEVVQTVPDSERWRKGALGEKDPVYAIRAKGMDDEERRLKRRFFGSDTKQ